MISLTIQSVSVRQNNVSAKPATFRSEILRVLKTHLTGAFCGSTYTKRLKGANQVWLRLQKSRFSAESFRNDNCVNRLLRGSTALYEVGDNLRLPPRVVL